MISNTSTYTFTESINYYGGGDDYEEYYESVVG